MNLNHELFETEWRQLRERERARIQRAIEHLRHVPTMPSLPPRRLDPLLCPCAYEFNPYVEHVPWCDLA